VGTLVTRGIRITAQPRFEPAHSDPKAERWLFSYRITIANQGTEAVQLLRREWVIRDSLAAGRQVQGDGVVGLQPIIAPGGEFSYSSACDLRSAFGRMDGRYVMQLGNGSEFTVDIPVMHLAAPLACN
jgi:ApaG protein